MLTLKAAAAQILPIRQSAASVEAYLPQILLPHLSTLVLIAQMLISRLLALRGNTPNVTAFSSLFSTPNGDWTFSALDLGSGDAGTLNNWSITVNYTVASTPQPVVWSPVTDLYTDAGATIAYAGDTRATVYAKPATSGTKVYTATATNGANCTNSATTTLTANPAPTVTLVADYCS